MIVADSSPEESIALDAPVKLSATIGADFEQESVYVTLFKNIVPGAIEHLESQNLPLMVRVARVSDYLHTDFESVIDFREESTLSTFRDLQRALHSYQQGLISLGRAAEIARLPYDVFMDELERRGIPLRLGPESPEEAEEEERRFHEAVERSGRRMRSP